MSSVESQTSKAIVFSCDRRMRLGLDPTEVGAGFLRPSIDVAVPLQASRHRETWTVSSLHSLGVFGFVLFGRSSTGPNVKDVVGMKLDLGEISLHFLDIPPYILDWPIERPI